MKEYNLPQNFLEIAIEIYSDYGIDIIKKENKKGLAVELSVPYNNGYKNIKGYDIFKKGNYFEAFCNAKKEHKLNLSKPEKVSLKELFQKVNEIKKNKERLKKSLDELVIVT
ncbi:MAG: hypothetical protein ACP5OG_03990 [Candidatus Nanoarchaeia archaeon]